LYHYKEKIIWFIFRKAHSVDETHDIKVFGVSTSTTVMRKHLYSVHLDEWVTTCDQLHIRITSKAAAEHVRNFRKEPAPTSLESERPEYSKEAFIDAIVDFVVGDDQVCGKFYLMFKISNQYTGSEYH